jgi:uncharacterized membrane protein
MEGQLGRLQRTRRRAMIARLVFLFLHGSSLLPRGHAFHTAPLPLPARRLPTTIVPRSASARSSAGAARAAQQKAAGTLLAFSSQTNRENGRWRHRTGTTAATTTALQVAPTTSLATSIAAGNGLFSWMGCWLPPLAALSLSALLGAKADRSKKGSGSGILVTLGTASLLKTLLGTTTTGTGASAIPQRCLDALLDMGWQVFLPASLVFLLLSLDQSETSQPTDSADLLDRSFSSSIAIRRLALPFVVACVGSVAGCAASYFASRQCWCWGSSTSSSLSSWGQAAARRLLLPPRDAALAASCLAASFVGGSVNFFATAAIVVVGPHATPHARALVSSMASVDLMVMAAYFASLGTMLQSKTLKKWFGDDPEEHDESSTAPSVAVERNLYGARRPLTVDPSRRWQANGVGIVLASALALLVVRLARFVERQLAPAIPGTACAFIAIAIPALQRLSLTERAIWTNMRRVSRPLSTYSFLWLFATIGMSIDITETLQEGPACLVFSIAALLVHMGVTLLGCWLLGWKQGHRRDLSSDKGAWTSAIRLEEALIASNAAIGGPATAAAFCGQLSDSNRRKAGLTVAATAYGVIGYGIGTTIGVTMFRWFTSIL